MSRVIRFWSIVILFATGMLVSPALASKTYDGTQDSGAVYRIYLPNNFKDWNGDLVVLAHSYVPPAAPGTLPEINDSDISIGGEFLPDLFTGMGYACAVTSYSKTGLAVVQGVADVVDLAGIFKAKCENPKHVYLVGLSQGGLVCTLALEQHPEIFNGGLSLCGPIGGFRRQINYWGDFRVIFDYFFPGLIPGSAVAIPLEVMLNWLELYEPKIISAISTDISTGQEITRQLLSVTRAAIDPDNPLISSLQTVIGLLRYNVSATNDARITLNDGQPFDLYNDNDGQPFDNLDRVYEGSDDDGLLNHNVQRFEADHIALEEIKAHYETSGHLNRPLVGMHTTHDPIVPYWHVALYQKKILQHGLATNFLIFPVDAYGHVNFTIDKVKEGFARLVDQVKGNR